MTQHINRSVIGPHQLLYLLYGDKEVYRLEARFSILSALRHRKNPADFTITLMTDQPEAFDGWPITVLSLSEETLGIWQGAGGYSHRRKACAIQAGVMLAGKTIFIDTDTVFFKDPALLFKRVTDDQFLMDEFELSWAQASRRAWYRPLVTHLDAEYIAPAPALRLFNSGVCGMTNANSHIVEGAISLIDQWAHLGARILTIEQIALSFMLYGRRVIEANDCINHYYAVKRYHHAMYRAFFHEQGEGYRDDLPEASFAVPDRLPRNPLRDRLRLKWKFMRQGAVPRKAAKFYMLGKRANRCPYLEACKLLWWAVAVEELKRLEAADKPCKILAELWREDTEFLSFIKNN
ncbi:hypothetical protein [Pseudomonas sp. TMW 2.1634]|uniref:hypothetical protein n=1 Tax=Pseudomonas sp. TMW 2.1634 TaxID=1886807 RepID=UPI000E7675D3|nr:hypothetical protein [Pseudomonas sp. TMW 2.1634]AOA06338.1 hypothetical protein BFC21_11300 [Pseudomonas sp. TMW 2.1634]